MEERKQSRYVKLTKDQTPLEDITPGELNQPIQVPQVTNQRFLLFFPLSFVEGFILFHLQPTKGINIAIAVKWAQSPCF